MEMENASKNNILN